ncbi:esterase [Nitrosomonas sp. Nm33]|uniref:esterase n=1 Tax=Nitrosomonas sp. Nm33 TaxID=133724 RepID=UPI000895480D|nr:esterase [Nitrosomonas sp. Nm33]SDZ09096.1 hypothetical protein SAMN05421755_11073 [Nitrosomonas sp. Nm33]
MIKNTTTILGKSSIRFFLVFTVFFIINGCAQKGAYRTDFTPCTFNQSDDCAQSAIQHHAPDQAAEYRLGFVEFDDQGQLHQRKQMEAVLDNYYPIAAKDDVLLILFIHGWHHDARPGDNNIQEFRKLLEKIARIENASANLNNHTPRKILGLYVGWRGESIEVPVLKETTFWERKNTAHEVGLQGVTELLLRLEEIVNVKTGMETIVPKPRNSRFIVIGHSFGGAVLYTALQQVMADRFVDSRPNKIFSDDAKGFGDLVVLMNPAFEAMRFATLYDISQQSCRHYFPSQLPRMAVLTSEKDYATRYAFPIGRFFSTIFETHTTLKRHHCTASGPKEIFIDEGEADRNTIGHFEPYLTHELVPATTKQLRGSDFSYRQLQNTWSKQTHEGTLHFEDVDLIHLGNTQPLNPYLNIYVDGKLIPDHNKIWGDSVISFIRDLIVLSSLPVK